MYQEHGNFQSGYRSRQPFRTAAVFFVSFLVFLTGLTLAGELRADDVRRYEITCNEEDLQYILENPLEDIYIDCIFRFGHIVRDDARLRLRGESSRLYPKKSFKVNFDRDHPFENRDKMNLVSEYLDPTFVQEFLAYDFYARAGLLASVAQFARLYINDRYYGLYLDVEQVDEYFLARADLPLNMSIYKAEEENSCLRLGDVLENYFTRETNDSSDFDDFYAFVNAINTALEETFRETLESYMDLPTLARVIAVNSLLANGSTYYHNYYLAQDISAGGQWLYLPWDMDRTFYTYGSHLAYDRAGHPLFGANTLIWRCWADSPIRDLIFQQYDALSQSLFTESVFQTAIDTLIPFLYDAVLEDTFAQYDIDDFTYNAGLIPSFVASRVSFMEERRAQAPLPFGPRGSTVSSCGVLLEWQPAQDAAASPITYDVYYGTDRLFDTLTTIITNLEASHLLLPPPNPGHYFWKTIAKNSTNETQMVSIFWEFDVEEELPGFFAPANIMSDTTWTFTGNPHIITENLTIHPAATLTLAPGVQTHLGPGACIQVQGRLVLAGVPGDSVILTACAGDIAWGSIFLDGPGAVLDASCAILEKGSSGIFITDNSCIQARDAVLTIADSRISDMPYWALRIINSQTDIRRTNFRRIDHEAINCAGGVSKVIGCTFIDCAQGPNAAYQHADIVDFENQHDGSIIADNLMIGAADDGIDFDDHIVCCVERNRISGMRDNGISVNYSGSKPFIANNIITECATAIEIKNNGAPVLFNNVFFGNGEAVYINDCNPDSTPGELWNSILWGNEQSIILSDTTLLQVGACIIEGDDVWPGIGNLKDDPQFINAAGGDFRIPLTSPAVDAGNSEGAPLLDFEGREREDIPDMPNTGFGSLPYYDIGVYEAFIEPPSVWVVWPGDLNDDGVVDETDVLPLAVNFGDVTPARSGNWHVWSGDTARDIESSEVALGDADGNGEVGLTDLLPICFHFGETHELTHGQHPIAPPQDIAPYRSQLQMLYESAEASNSPQAHQIAEYLRELLGLEKQNPNEFRLCGVYPNPFNSSVAIRYEIPTAGSIQLKIYNLLGREVFMLDREEALASRNVFIWNGTDFHGQAVASGLYFFTLKYEKKSFRGKLLLLR